MLFQLFILATRWTPEFCHGHTSTYPGCSDPEPMWNSTLTLHGLWPQYQHPEGGHAYPEFCDSPYGPDIVEDDVDPLMYHYWPNVEAEPEDPDYLSFWEHEWVKHGTCTTFNQSEYFETALSLYLNNFTTPAVVSGNVGYSTTAEKIHSSFPVDTAVGCQSSYLDQIFTCWDVDFDQIQCPDNVMEELHCPDLVDISSF